MMKPNPSLHLFCRVVDNFGDIGVCWRLARQLQSEHGLQVHLWVDDLVSFRVLCAEVQIDAASQTSSTSYAALDRCAEVQIEAASQTVQQIQIHHWRDLPAQDWAVVAQADVMIEAFACELPGALVQAMAAQDRPPCWINLDYLSAVSWVAGCHGLLSVHPQWGLKKYFYFPGFSEQTGGLLFEATYAARKQAFLADLAAREAFLLRQFSVQQKSAWMVLREADVSLFSLFCYPSAPIRTLLTACANAPERSLWLVAQGVAEAALADFFAQPMVTGQVYQQGTLSVFVLPFLSQPEYDQLLWSCDMNFVRGEDSFVRAQLAGKPFIWQIYPQQEQAHLLKLDAFLQQYVVNCPTAEQVSALWHTWNSTHETDLQVFGELPQFARQTQGHAEQWAAELLQASDLATRLVQFIEKIS
ncbi:MAG: elongation factor P maturation arginine rhamnosyltransferase EarP [Burkholderiaceae bacterium]|nr:elongation factor P maturation arginine rhamnosyltransferase EarP [Burkholderiaceae bacterium]